MRIERRGLQIIAVTTPLAVLALAASASAQRPSPAAALPAKPLEAGLADEEWVRSQRDDSGQVTNLQTAIGRYEGTPPGASAPVRVDLVGAIHVGDHDYYQELNRRFSGYDAVLYELVAPQGTVVPRGGRVGSDNPLGAMQNGMKGLLALEHQLEIVDYTRPNFVHADMSPEQLFATMEARDEGILKLYFRMVGQGIAEQTKAAQKGESAEFDLMRAMFSNDRPRRMKMAMAGQLTQLEGLLTSFGGEKGTTLIHERNRTAMDVLAKEIAAGKRTIAVFYGAGHLVDMEKRLRERFHLRQTGKEWLTAWDLTE
ncbi:hypothetical protein Pla108_36000 [Botrimarina colliarenosi]|uniref:TraB family protein n=1 Tax=Botrimarina colliarenosi TaxID=2528001 RepID=A0A5C6A6Q1_9BACT|nr:hypothetical protein [Botrimarina colliarenosi]TWT94751.1 hypothetical protein Pla108_36000 [Botrimarina colliarenosi]